MEPSEALFDDDFIKKLEYLNLVSKQMVPGHLHGEHRSKKKTSSGIEFSDYRNMCQVRIQKMWTGEHSFV